ncbi:Uncharacterised protein [Enterobacter cloacae]|nr:Uncharacterised protein [Enterobacter cloacae]
MPAQKRQVEIVTIRLLPCLGNIVCYRIPPAVDALFAVDFWLRMQRRSHQKQDYPECRKEALHRNSLSLRHTAIIITVNHSALTGTKQADLYWDPIR